MLLMLPQDQLCHGIYLDILGKCLWTKPHRPFRSIPARKSATHWAAWLKYSRKYKQWSLHSPVTDHNQQLRLVLRGVSRLSGKEVNWKARLWERQACRKGPRWKEYPLSCLELQVNQLTSTKHHPGLMGHFLRAELCPCKNLYVEVQTIPFSPVPQNTAKFRDRVF